MVKRLLVGLVIFFISLGLFMLPSQISIYRGIAEGATGFGFVAGSVGENIFRAGVLLVSMAFAYRLSGKLLGH